MLPGKTFHGSHYEHKAARDHKYTEFMDFMRWCVKMSRVCLFGASPWQANGHCEEPPLKGRVIAVSTLLGRWMCALKIERSRPNHPIKLQLTKRSVISS